jgi:crossover junction endodeoxyribonuclease RuvC
MKSQRILGIDPGYDRLGWAVGEVRQDQFFLVDVGLCHAEGQKNPIDRQKNLHGLLARLFTDQHPNVLAIETLYFVQNTSTAMGVSEVRGMLMALAFQHHVEVFQYHPTEIKLTVTGNGQADKKAVQKMLMLQLSTDPQAKALLESPQIDDTYDAVAILYTDVLRRAALA